MGLLDELKAMYGLSGGMDDDPVNQMMAVEPPPPPELDPQVLSATTDDMSQPMDAGAQDGGLGHPDVLSFVKELETSGQLTGSKEPTAPKGMVGAQTTIRSEQGGVPPEVRAQGVAVQGQSELNQGQRAASGLLEQADELERRAAYLRQDAEVENEKRQREEAELEARQARLRSQQSELAAQDDEPINPDRYIQNKSLIGKAAALISAFTYGFLGGRGQPPIMEALAQAAHDDVQAQMANNAQKRGKRNALIEQYERQYGDSTLVAKRLEADKLLTMSKQAKAEAMDARTAEARAKAEELQGMLQDRVGELHQSIQEATYGKPVEVSTTYAPPKPRGTSDGMAEAMKAMEFAKKAQELGYSEDQTNAFLKQRGLALPTGASSTTLDRQGKAVDLADKTNKRDEGQGKALAAWRTIQELGDEAGLKRSPGGDFVVEDTLGSRLNLPELGEKVSGVFGGATPIGNARKVAIEALGRLESGGAIQKDEQALFAQLLGAASSRQQIADVLNRVQVVVEPRLKYTDQAEEERKKRQRPTAVTGRVPL